MKLPQHLHIQRRRNVERLRSHIARARYFRGHGVHSPFVYDIVREVFMKKRRIQSNDIALYGALCKLGVHKMRAAQLQNLFTHCGYATFAFDVTTPADLMIATVSIPVGDLHTWLRVACERQSTLCILDPYESVARRDCCLQLVETHRSTSIDNRAYLLFFHGELPKQHFKI